MHDLILLMYNSDSWGRYQITDVQLSFLREGRWHANPYYEVARCVLLSCTIVINIFRGSCKES